MKKLILTYGIIAGVVVSSMMLFSFGGSGVDFDFEYGEIIGYTTMLIAFSTIFFAVKSHRDKYLNGSIQFGKAFKIGIGITLIATIMYVISWMIISETMAQDFMTEYYQHSIEKLRASNLTESEINQQIKEMERFKELYKNPLIKMGMTFLEIFPVGFIVSLLSAFILKRK